MANLAAAQSLKELKTIYRKLAAIHHPDRGGCVQTMQRLNQQYQSLQERLKLAANDPRREPARPTTTQRPVQPRRPQPTRKPQQRCDFSKIAVGDRVYVNSTLCEVMGVTDDSFRVQAIGRYRQSVFDRKTGIGVFNRRLRASLSPVQPRYH